LTVTKIYHSREDRIGDLHTDAERVQYDGKDAQRIQDVAETLTQFTVGLIDSLGSYRDEVIAPVDEDSESRMGYARRDLIEKWAMTQGALSKIAWALRFDGNTAYERAINAFKSDEAMDMRGL
jgi:hypothetical protein